MPEQEVVLRWLQGERDKGDLHNWMQQIGAPISLLSLISDDATIDDAEDNRIRGLFLGFRGYPNDPRGGLFIGWPDDAHWSLVSVTREELLDLRYIAKDKRWLDIGGGTRDPKEGARRLLAGLPHRATAADFDIRPDLPLGSIIAVSDGVDCVLVEGHNRVTAIALHPDECPDALQIYLARSVGFRHWYWWA